MIKQIVDQINFYNARLFDVFLTGPLRIYLSQFVKNEQQKRFLLIWGIMNILFNGYNYLHYDEKSLTIPINVINTYNDPIKGKPQLHRLFLLLVMYPMDIHILLTNDFDTIPRILYTLMIIFGFIYNAYNFVNY